MVFLDIIKIRYRELERKFASWIFGPSERIVEYSFIIKHIPFISKAKILEIGCSGSSLSHKLACMGFEVHALDLRPYSFTHKNLKFSLGDILKKELPNNYFDCIIMVSTIEHIGMGAYNKELNLDGDMLAMTKVINSIKAKGTILITTPIAPVYKEIDLYERYYDFSRLSKLVHGFQINLEEYYAPHKRVFGYGFNWKKISKEEVKKGKYLKYYSHATVCMKLIKNDS